MQWFIQDQTLAIKCILRYLQGTIKNYLYFAKRELKVRGYIGELNHWKSTIGYVFNVDTTTINWMSQIQNIILLSNIDVEYVVVIEASKKMNWLQGF